DARRRQDQGGGRSQARAGVHLSRRRSRLQSRRQRRLARPVGGARARAHAGLPAPARRVSRFARPRSAGLNRAPVPAPLTDTFRIAIAQIDPIVGDVEGNRERARKARTDAAGKGADLIVLPELFVSGYPPEDLVLKPA